MSDLWRIRVRVPAAARDACEAALAPFCQAVSSFEEDAGATWRIEGLAEGRPERPRVVAMLAAAAASRNVPFPDPEMTPLAPRDWLAETARAFPPFRVGRYFVHGSHFAGPVPAGAIGLRIDAGRAFGSGKHGSTAGCLDALDRLARNRRFRAPLDMGCGSGILAVAIAKTWPVAILAADNDAQAVMVARENARLNGVAALVRAVRGDGYRSAAVRRGAPYDLVACNILAGSLCRMAAGLSRNLGRRGVAVLSGFVESDSNRVLDAHRRVGLRLLGRIAIGGWTTLLLSR